MRSNSCYGVYIGGDVNGLTDFDDDSSFDTTRKFDSAAGEHENPKCDRGPTEEVLLG